VCTFQSVGAGARARAWKAIADRLQAPSYLSRVDHNCKIRARKQRTDVGKYSFVNRTITDWTQLSEAELGFSQVIRIASERVWKVITRAAKRRI
jgi:hypothetical protein